MAWLGGVGLAGLTELAGLAGWVDCARGAGWISGDCLVGWPVGWLVGLFGLAFLAGCVCSLARLLASSTGECLGVWLDCARLGYAA